MNSIDTTLISILNACENETKIKERRLEHLAFLLTLFSPLSFYFGNKFVKRGWVQSIFVGDTRTGKTEIAEAVLKFYGQGRLVSAENLSLAGLVGGIEQVRNKRFLKWGTLPLMDKRIVVLDEISGMPVEDINRISGIRSSGVAEITKIITAKTNARTRQLWISNPRYNKFIHDFNTGIEALLELIKSPEDIARFDLAVIFREEDVPDRIINSLYTEKKTEYIQEYAKKHLLFIWSRRPEQYIIPDETLQYIMAKSMELSKIYSPEIPLIHSAEMRIKLARLTISFANLILSITKNNDILILPEYVDFVCKYLQELYNKAEYNLYSEPYLQEQTHYEDDHYKNLLKYEKDKLIRLLQYKTLTLKDILLTLELDKDDGRFAVQELIKLKLIYKEYTYYRKSKGFIELLKRWKYDIEKVPEDDIPF